MLNWEKKNKDTWVAYDGSGRRFTVSRKVVKRSRTRKTGIMSWQKTRVSTSTTLCWLFIRDGDTVVELDTAFSVRDGRAALEKYAATGQGNVKRSSVLED